MSTTTQRIPLADAREEALEFKRLFTGCYSQWTIAGSVRRQRPDVGDIDHVAIPASGQDPGAMFGGEAISLFHERAFQLLGDGAIKRKVEPRSMRGREKFKTLSVIFRGRAHQVFLCQQNNFGCILTIRTGNSIFSRDFVNRLRRHGHRQADSLLYEVAPYKQGGMSLLARPGSRQFEGDLVGAPVNCPDEATYFRAAGLDVADYPPEKREALP